MSDLNSSVIAANQYIFNHHWKLRDVTCKKHLKSFCKQVHIL